MFAGALLILRAAGVTEAPLAGFDFTVAGLGALLISPLIAYAETQAPQRSVRRGRLVPGVLGRALGYVLLIVLTYLLTGGAVNYVLYPERDGGRSLGEFWARELTSAQFRTVLLWSSVLVALVTFYIHLVFALGRRNMASIFTGRYRRPVEERRLFAFVDLVGSTTIAERIGPLAFTHFKHDFFCELTAPLARAGGAIVQYVGDEVMLTWRLRRRGPPAADVPVLDMLGEVRASVRARADYYHERYGALPEFRAGVHAGDVVVAEVGDLRRDIVYSGDVVNAAARLLQACRPAGVAVLISEAALAYVRPPASGTVRSLPPITLRGRSGGLAIATVER